MTDSPRISDTAPRLGIEITAAEHPATGEGILVRGTYKIPYPGIGVPTTATLIPKHIAVAVTCGDNHGACKPFYDIVVFEDDIQADETHCAGHFKFNVLDHIGFDDAGDYYIICSLGTHLSNMVKVTITA